MSRFSTGFLSGAIAVIVSAATLVAVSISSERDFCRLQNYKSDACQCRIALDGDRP